LRAVPLPRIGEPDKGYRVLHQLAGRGRDLRSRDLRHDAVYPLAGLDQPSGGAQGQATDIEIQAREILALRARLNEMYVRHTGQPLEVIQAAVERDKFLSPLEAKEFGLVDEVVEARPNRDEERGFRA
jgi:hypothetical protein